MVEVLRGVARALAVAAGVLALLALVPPSAAVATDPYGMVKADSVSDGIPWAWEDITALPGYTALALTDDSFAAVNLNFPVNFYGTQQQTVYIGSNGYLTFGAGATTFTAAQLPAAFPAQIVAAYWNDLNPSCGGQVGHIELGAAPQRRFIAQWTDIQQYGCTVGSASTFQIVLHEDQPKNAEDVWYEIRVLTGASSNTVSIGVGRAGVGGFSLKFGTGAVDKLAATFTYPKVPPRADCAGTSPLARGSDATFTLAATTVDGDMDPASVRWWFDTALRPPSGPPDLVADADGDGNVDAAYPEQPSWHYGTDLPPGMRTIRVEYRDVSGKAPDRAVGQCTITLTNAPPLAFLERQGSSSVNGTALVTALGSNPSRDPDGDPSDLRFFWALPPNGACEEDPGAAHQVLCRWPHAGLHEVAVAVLDADGATSFAVERVDVRQPSPAVAFEVVGSPRVGCGTATQVLLRDTSVPDGAPIERWAWDIGADGSVEHTGPELAWTPARAGHHAVRLTVVDAAGFTGTVTRMVPVDGVATPVPMLHRSPAGTIYTGVPLLVWDRSIPGDAPLGPAAWDLGDGALATGPSVTHLYEKPGRYIVQLTVADSFGCVGVATDVVRVEAMEPLAYEPAPARRLQPRIEAPSQVAVGELVRFRDATPTTEGAIVAWQWDIPGTQVPAEPQAQARFAAPGVHAVALTVTDSAGHTATAVHELRVTQAAVPSVAAVPPPVARAGADRLVLPGATVRLDGGDSVSHAGKELLYRWEQVAGPAVQLHGAATQAPSFVAPDAAEGALLVFRLTVADTAGRSQPDDVVLRVQPRTGPAVVAEVDGPVVRLRAEALPGETVEWELGDGKTATGPEVTHTFTRAGRYEVVARAGGHATTTSVEVTLPTRERPALAEEQAAPAARIAGIPAQAVAGAFAATVAVAGGALAVALRRR